MRKSNWFLGIIAVVVILGLIYVDRAQGQVNVIETNGPLDNSAVPTLPLVRWTQQNGK